MDRFLLTRYVEGMSENQLDAASLDCSETGHKNRWKGRDTQASASKYPLARAFSDNELGSLKSVSIHPAVVAEVNGLRLPVELPLEVWRTIGERLADIVNASAWWIGDWLVYGQDKYPDRYKRAIARTSLDYQTLRNYSWIARKFEYSRRRKGLSFQHHVEVAALPSDEQEHWLQFAEKFEWSRNELRKQIKNSSEEVDASQSESSISVRIDLDDDQLRHWKRAAERSNHSLPSWILATLDAVANESGGNN